MDVWSWFEDAADQLADQDPALAGRLWNLPSLVVDGRHHEVEAVVPELLAAARRLRLPWLEVFVRHWRLQSLVLHQGDVTRGLAEAVSLVERAHREDAIGCPQSVCAAQDLCAAYGYADGPGWAAERIRVASETLARIDPTWPCWTCIAGEKCSALLDAGEPDQALVFARSSLDAMTAAGEPTDPSDLVWERCHALLALGRAEEALALIEGAHQPEKGDAFELERRVELARALSVLGRLDEAHRLLPSWSEVENAAPMWDRWSETVAAVILGEVRPWDTAAVRTFADMARRLLALGCPRDTIDVALRGVDTAIGRGSRAVGEALLALATTAVGRLRTTGDVPERLAARRDLLAQLPVPPVPDDPEAALASLEGARFDMLQSVARRFPELPGVLPALAEKWRSQGFPDRAREALEDAVAARPDDALLFVTYGQALLDLGDHPALAVHLAPWDDPSVPGDLPCQAAWLRAMSFEVAGDRDGAATALDRLLEARPGWGGAAVPLRLAGFRRQLGQLALALRAYEAAIDRIGAPSDTDWDRMVVATWLDRWDAVRDSARRLGLPVEPGTEPIEEDWGVCRITLAGVERPLFACRTGPVTARILQICGPTATERYGDVVVFEPARLDPADDGHPPLFRADGTKTSADYEGFALDGVHPGEERVAELVASLRELGAAVQITSTDDYTLDDPATDTSHRGLYLRVAIPSPMLRAPVAARFARVASSGAPLVWIELAEALGDPAEVERQRRLFEAWGM